MLVEVTGVVVVTVIVVVVPGSVCVVVDVDVWVTVWVLVAVLVAVLVEVLVTVSVLVLVTVSVTVGGSIEEVDDVLELLVVDEPEDHSGVPADSEPSEVPICISSLCKPKFCRMPLTPQDVP